MRYLLMAGVLLVLLAGCAEKPVKQPEPDSYVVLMKNPDGSTGKIIVSDKADHSATVDKAGYAVELNDPAAGAHEADQAKLEQDFGAAMAARPELPVTFTLYFETGGTVLTPESKALIPKVLQAVENRPAPDISIIGHTDTVGKADANEALALERAKAMAGIIEKAGLKTKDVTVASHGERNLLIETPDETPEAKNRRIEITIR